MRRLIFVAVMLALAVPTPASAAETPVAVKDNFFDPAAVTLTVGDSVKWTFEGNRSHYVKSNSPEEPFTSSPQETPNPRGSTYAHTFTKPGTFLYECPIHSEQMKGQITVGPASPPAQLNAPAPATPPSTENALRPADAAPPRVDLLRIRLRGTRARASFRLSEDARVVARIESSARPRRVVRRLTLRGRRGANRRTVSIKTMRPGRYVLVVAAIDAAGNRAVTLRKRLTVPRR